MFPDGYNETNIPDISTWPQFQNWMRPSALATFNKLALRNDSASLEPGIYQINVGLHFPVTPYNGKKYLYITQRSVIGGKTTFGHKLDGRWRNLFCIGFNIVGYQLH